MSSTRAMSTVFFARCMRYSWADRRSGSTGRISTPSRPRTGRGERALHYIQSYHLIQIIWTKHSPPPPRTHNSENSSNSARHSHGRRAARTSRAARQDAAADLPRTINRSAKSRLSSTGSCRRDTWTWRASTATCWRRWSSGGVNMSAWKQK